MVSATPPNTFPLAIRTKPLILQLESALKDEDFKGAWGYYRRLRRRNFAPDSHHTWLKIQHKLMFLIYKTKLRWQDSPDAARLYSKIETLDSHKETVIRDMTHRTLIAEGPEFSSLVDALAHSKATVQHSYSRRSKTAMGDWRNAFGVLEAWCRERASLKLIAALQIDKKSEPTTKTRKQAHLEYALSTWLRRIFSQLVYTYTHLVRSTLETLPDQFGIQATTEMYLVLIKYYAMQGQSGTQDILDTVTAMSRSNVPWMSEPQVYDRLLFALSHVSGNTTKADRIIEEMLSNDVMPRKQTMVAAILCAARSGDLEACSRYITQMHLNWNLSLTERMKAILLYACAQRGDFDTAFEILQQLSKAGPLVDDGPSRPHSLPLSKRAASQKRRAKKETQSVEGTEVSHHATLEEALQGQDIVNVTNLLLALINETHAKRIGKDRRNLEFLKNEVAKVLELFTMITQNPDHVDTQLYTIMMQYLSTLPSPLPGMMYLYKEMRVSKRAKPNVITFKVMMDACAEQMEMGIGQTLWADMAKLRIKPDSHVRASYVKGWGRIGNIKAAEDLCMEGWLVQQKSRTGLLAIPDATSLTVLHELMRANRASNLPYRVVELYREIEGGRWGPNIRPNQFTLSLVLQACGAQSSSVDLVDQGIEIVEHFVAKQQQELLEQLSGQRVGIDEIQETGATSHSEIPQIIKDEDLHSGLSDVNYQLYFTMLGRHHRQRKMLEVWDEMMWQSTTGTGTITTPSRMTVSIVIESLENVQWGAGPIKRIRKELRTRWPNVQWLSNNRSTVFYADIGDGVLMRSGGVDDDGTTGAGGRFWRL
ncbi:hypothetical protein BG004_004237 [Podila humilis]|nr:hypothetical protein BG004_004237 [Podila humilis]